MGSRGAGSSGAGGSGLLLAEQTETFPPDPRTPGEARRLVRRLLDETDRGQWSETAELVVSEVVSNAVLHAHTEIEISVRVGADTLRVDVLDHNPLLPTQRSYGEHATTGRGLGLVATLATHFGIDAHEGDGKTVWFCIGDTDREVVPDLDAWDTWDTEQPAAHDPHPGDGSERRTARLLALPVSLWLAAQQHHDALIREYLLSRSEEVPSRPVLPEPAIETVLSADDAQAMLAAAVERAVDEAVAAGAPTQLLPPGHPSPLPEVPPRLDVEIALDPDGAPAFSALQDTLDAAERLAGRGLLLARPALPEVVAVRDWACEQVIAQLGGVEASPWPGLDDGRVLEHGPADALPEADWDPEVVRRSDRAVVAADETNRIVAVSEPLARLVGWEPEDLVSRRVVVLIPPRLRELHVAGFTRHLTTGQAHVLGVPLELPVLHADGRELTCHFLVERVPDTGSRAVYLAWISQLPPPPATERGA